MQKSLFSAELKYFLKVVSFFYDDVLSSSDMSAVLDATAHFTQAGVCRRNAFPVSPQNGLFVVTTVGLYYYNDYFTTITINTKAGIFAECFLRCLFLTTITETYQLLNHEPKHNDSEPLPRL